MDEFSIEQIRNGVNNWLCMEKLESIADVQIKASELLVAVLFNFQSEKEFDQHLKEHTKKAKKVKKMLKQSCSLFSQAMPYLSYDYKTIQLQSANLIGEYPFFAPEKLGRFLSLEDIFELLINVKNQAPDKLNYVKGRKEVRVEKYYRFLIYGLLSIISQSENNSIDNRMTAYLFEKLESSMPNYVWGRIKVSQNAFKENYYKLRHEVIGSENEGHGPENVTYLGMSIAMCYSLFQETNEFLALNLPSANSNRHLYKNI